MQPTEFAAKVAHEIDRLVISGHDAAAAFPDKPPAVERLKAHPGLLNTVAVVMLRGPLTRDDVALTLAYTPPKLVTALIDNNVDEGVITDEDGRLGLTDDGRAIADGIVELQELAVADTWTGADDALKVVEVIASGLVEQERTPPTDPSAFVIFAPVCDRPSLPGRVLRLITAIRYWRADAHRRALTDAGLSRPEAHALNRLWDAHRTVERVGQGFPDPGRGLADLETRGLAADGAITEAGLALREEIEAGTNAHTAPLYAVTDDAARRALLDALRALPG